LARHDHRPRAVQIRARATISSSVRRLTHISEIAIDFPWTTIAFWIAVSIAGLVSFFQLKYALLPDITFPVVVVNARTTQSDPQANERDVTNVLEARFRALKGVTSIHSVTYPQFVSIDMAFDVGNALEVHRAQVEEAIDGLQLPAGTSTTVVPINLNESPVVTYAITQHGRSMANLARVGNERVRPVLLRVPGVLKVDVVGDSSSGSDASAYRVDGESAIGVSVVKRSDANTLEVASAVNDQIAGIQASVPSVTIRRTATQATYIRQATQATTEALGLAVLLAILVIYPFLRDFRATVISAIAIPVSLLGTALVMRLFHFDLESITLLALALVVGVILDDAIVAVENIVRHLEAGETPIEAALKANREIGLTLIAASLTIVAVFLPIGLMGGTLGQFFKPFGLTASAAVLLSLLAARTLSPTLAAWWLRARKKRTERDVDVSLRYPFYRLALEWSLRHPIAVVALALVSFVAGLALIPFIPKGFIPHLDRGEFQIAFQTPAGTELSDTIAAAQRLETAARANPDVLHVYTVIGARSGQSNVGTVDVTLRPDRRSTTYDVENVVRPVLPELDGVTVSVSDIPFVGSDATKPLEFALLGQNMTRLHDYGRQMQAQLAKVRGIVDLSVTGISNGTPFTAIEHVEGHRAVRFAADLANNVLVGDADDAVTKLARKILPKDVKLSFGGNSADAATTFRGFGITLGLSVVAIVVVLVALFRGWVDPLVISLGLPLSIVGAFFMLWITRAEFGMISLMGVVFLFGLVNKNAILLVDRIERLREYGLHRTNAIVEAGSQRLRPIVMTTAATCLGMLPIALGFGAGAELRQPMAVAIIGGLLTNTALSLIVIPVFYTIADDIRQRTARK